MNLDLEAILVASFFLFERQPKKRCFLTGSMALEMMLEWHWSDVISGSITDIFFK